MKQANQGMAKLSSGTRINKAADDAASLAISEKMRTQIRGLLQAQQNIQDGISLVQVADGAMGEIQELLQRARELTVQSTNDTNTDQDRQHIQAEVNQIIKEIDGISKRTQFNTLNLLNGRYNKDGDYVAVGGISDYVQYITSTGGITETYSYTDGAQTKDYASAVIDFSNIQTVDDVQKLDGKGVHYTCATCDRAFSIKFVNGNLDNSNINAYHPVMEVDISNLTDGEGIVNAIIDAAYGQANVDFNPITPNLPSTATEFVKHFSKLAADGDKLYIYDDRPENNGQNWPTSDGRGVFEPIVYGGSGPVEDLFLALVLQTGSNANENLTIWLPNVTIDQLNIVNVLVNTQNNSSNAITQLDKAVDRVSNARAIVGAYQNRLEHTYNNVSNVHENTTASESRNRDADMAKESIRLAKFQLLNQTAYTALTQTNQRMGAVLNLLR